MDINWQYAVFDVLWITNETNETNEITTWEWKGFE